jgi:hypothetical protein
MISGCGVALGARHVVPSPPLQYHRAWGRFYVWQKKDASSFRERARRMKLVCTLGILSRAKRGLLRDDS